MVAACGVTAGSSVSVDEAENAVRAPARAGHLAPGSSAEETLAAIVAAVRADAARAWRVSDPAALAVTSADVMWADGAIGCPLPGRLYTQALVPGWRIDVRGPGSEAVYHASKRGQWLWCPASRAQAPHGAPLAR